MTYKNYKILFTGPPGSGKTTAIASISDNVPVFTDVKNTDLNINKEKTTVGMDFGQIRLNEKECVSLFGTPGQIRFNFMWAVLAKNAFGIIILLDARNPEIIKTLDTYLDNFSEVLSKTSCTIGIGWNQEKLNLNIDKCSEHLNKIGLLIPVLDIDVRKRDDVLLLIDTILAQAASRA